MNLREEILKENSRNQALKVAGWIGNDNGRFSQLLDIFLYDDYRAAQLSAHILSFVADKYPELAEKNINAIVDKLNDSNSHTAVKRNIVRILQFVKIPKNLNAFVMNKCFDYLSDPNETIAVRCFSMTVLVNFTKHYPEIRNELEAVLKAVFKDVKGGLKVRARETLKEINRVH